MYFKIASIAKLPFLFLCMIVESSQLDLTVTPNVGSLNDTYPDYSKYIGHFLIDKFPDGFQWGSATSAYQVEGGWNADGKGPSIWDTYVRELPSPIEDGSTGNVACDSYHKFPVDVQNLKKLGVNFYRFSLSWSRILPDGTVPSKNQAGIDYYNRLIDHLLAHDIEPMVTLYHWDLPEALQKRGGWLNEDLVLQFADYAYLAFRTFGDRVKTWNTFSEPSNICVAGYGIGYFAPGIKEIAVEPYICGNTILKAHALAYRIYDNIYRPVQHGRIGMTLYTFWYEPGTNHIKDVHAAERALQFEFGWFASPMLHGNYPEVMRELIGKKSAEEGLLESRLPKLTRQWQIALNGSWDFVGLSHYTTELVKDDPETSAPGWIGDQETFKYQDPHWEGSASPWIKVVPWGFRRLLNWIKERYGNPLVLVTENGVSGDQSEELYDPKRISYFKEYINNMLKAVVLDGCNVGAYTAWSLMDNFEWSQGYTQRFGLFHVDFTNDKLTRTPKASATFLEKIFKDNGFLEKPKQTHE